MESSIVLRLGFVSYGTWGIRLWVILILNQRDWYLFTSYTVLRHPTDVDFSITLKLKSKSTYFSNIFYQADMQWPPVYIEIKSEVPLFNRSMNFLQLKKSLYGQVVRFSQDTVYQDQDGIRWSSIVPMKSGLYLFILKREIYISYWYIDSGATSARRFI